MADLQAGPEQIELGTSPIDGFRPLLDREQWAEFRQSMAGLARALQGHTLWNVNSTGRGGGVAELLGSLIPYTRGRGVDERWLVIEGSPEFFEVTKKLHTLLHGIAHDGARLPDGDREIYERTMSRNAAALEELIRPGDVVILHDPQTAGLTSHLTAHGVPVIWRSHIGVDRPNAEVRGAWLFLRPYIAEARALVFSRRAYAWHELDPSRVHIIAPCIDPFSAKNRDLSEAEVTTVLRSSGILRGASDHALRQAQLTGDPAPEEARIVLQVSRWDRLKDPIGVLNAFVKHIANRADCWLVIAGPAATSVDDDPEQPEVLRELVDAREAQSPAIRSRLVIAQLPMADLEENAAIVNALQRRADVVVQKSLAEGFGLTVAEAMWKARPVVASRVGGIEDQIESGRSGILIDDPHDLEAFGGAVAGLLQDKPLRERISGEARLRIIKHFLAPRYLTEQAKLVLSVLD